MLAATGRNLPSAATGVTDLAAVWLSRHGYDGAEHGKINRIVWRPALCAVYDSPGEHGLDEAVRQTSDVRDKLHQDQIGACTEIDWRAGAYKPAFIPANHATGTLPRREPDAVPERSNLNDDPA